MKDNSSDKSISIEEEFRILFDEAIKSYEDFECMAVMNSFDFPDNNFDEREHNWNHPLVVTFNMKD